MSCGPHKPRVLTLQTDQHGVTRALLVDGVVQEHVAHIEMVAPAGHPVMAKVLLHIPVFEIKTERWTAPPLIEEDEPLDDAACGFVLQSLGDEAISTCALRKGHDGPCIGA